MTAQGEPWCTKKVWCPELAPAPDGELVSSRAQSMPNWFREEPELAAELYALEMYGESNEGHDALYEVHIITNDDVLHRFNVRIRKEPVAHIERLK